MAEKGKMKRILIVLFVLLGLTSQILAEQCMAITQKGNRCKRSASVSSKYCWQHKRMKEQGGSSTKMNSSQSRILPTANSSISSGGAIHTNYEKKQCQAKLPDSSRCTRDANPGEKYCFRHTGIDSKTVDVTNDEHIRNTKMWMRDIDEAVRNYMQSTKGPPPANLIELRTQMGAIVSHLKDSWGTPFYYETDGLGYAIASDGPDRKPETEDDLEIMNSNTTKRRK